MTTSSKIRPCLWFDGQAAEAAKFYVQLFNTSPHAAKRPQSRLMQDSHYAKDAKQHCQDFEVGTVLTADFELAGQGFLALNGGPMFKFSPAISLMIECEDQAEIDHFWDGLSEGVKGRELNCGWVNDRFGVSWQVVPRLMQELAQVDKAKSSRLQVWMMKALPKKFVIDDMLKAADGDDGTTS